MSYQIYVNEIEQNENSEKKNEMKEKNNESNNYNLNSNSIKLSKYEILIESFDEHCEIFSRIKKVVPLKKSKEKIFLLIILNIFTFSLSYFFLLWFPKLYIYLYYKKCDLFEAEFLGIFSNDDSFYIEKIQKIFLPELKDSKLKKYFYFNYKQSNSLLILFKFKLFLYYYDFNLKKFNSFKFDINCKKDKILKYLSQGLTNEEVLHQKKLFGLCDLIIIIPTVTKLLKLEFSDPFSVFAFFCIILWYANNYLLYSSILLVTTVLTIGTSIYDTIKNYKNLQEMAKYSCKIKILRENNNNNNNNNENNKIFIEMNSTEIVPGDVFELPEEGKNVPCDCILLNGNVIVNESILTGESTPITKQNILKNKTYFNKTNDNQNILFAGTKIIQKIEKDNKKILVLCYKTGFETEKGNLIRNILFPKKVESKFIKDSYKYIIILSIISIIGFLISLPFIMDLHPSKLELFIKGIEVITTAVPPSLPACVGVGIIYALNRLKKKHIYCINRDRLNISGITNCIVFDKTGTLTQDHLDIMGFLPCFLNKSNNFEFDNLQKNINSYLIECNNNNNLNNNSNNKTNNFKQLFIECLSTCHSISKHNEKLIGDPIDIKMFLSTKSNFIPSSKKNFLCTISNNSSELNIIHRFDFSSKLQRMTVICKDNKNEYYKIFTKGSPEKIISNCNKNTIPSNFEEILNDFAIQGFRILALACKFMIIEEEQLNNLIQEEIEHNFIFLGLLIIENKLKKNTTKTIDKLHQSQIKMIMATGDNNLTALSVAKECHLIKNNNLFSLEIENENLFWKKIDLNQNINNNINKSKINSQTNENLINDENNSSILSNNNFDFFLPENFHESNKHLINFSTSNTNNNEKEEEENEDSISSSFTQRNQTFFSERINIQTSKFSPKINSNFILSISGQNFEKIYKKKKKFLLTKNTKYKIFYETFKIILNHCIIYSRMSPEHKTLLVENLREENFNVLMCGDGANDCGALRAADVGVSLSPEEASIAAHFTSKIKDISCLITLLKEGKCSLVTSIQTFKYMMIYSLIQFFNVMFLTILNSYLSDFQWLISDVFVIFPLEFLIARTAAYEKLTKDIPEYSLISFPILNSIILHIIIIFMFQFFSILILKNYDWYFNFCEVDGAKVFGCYDNNTLFLLGMIQYYIAAISFSVDKPFRKKIFSNKGLMLYLSFSLFLCFYMILFPAGWIKKIVPISDFEDWKFNVVLMIVGIVNFVVEWSVERFFVTYIERLYRNYKLNKMRNEIISNNEKYFPVVNYYLINNYEKNNNII